MTSDDLTDCSVRGFHARNAADLLVQVAVVSVMGAFRTGKSGSLRMR